MSVCKCVSERAQREISCAETCQLQKGQTSLRLFLGEIKRVATSFFEINKGARTFFGNKGRK